MKQFTWAFLFLISLDSVRSPNPYSMIVIFSDQPPLQTTRQREINEKKLYKNYFLKISNTFTFVLQNAIENIIIPDVTTSKNTKVKNKPPTNDGSSSSEAEPPVPKKSKSKVPVDKNKLVKEAVTRSSKPTPPHKAASTSSQLESSDASDESPLLEKSSVKTPVPAKSSEKRPVPVKSSEKTPVPAKSSEKTPVPAKSSDKTPVSAKSSEKTPVPVKSSDKTSEDVPEEPVTKRKLGRSDVTAKRKKVSVIEFSFPV